MRDSATEVEEEPRWNPVKHTLPGKQYGGPRSITVFPDAKVGVTHQNTVEGR